MKSELWITEPFKDFYKMQYRVDKTIFSGQSDFQSVDIVETRFHGKMLLNDGLVMVTEKDEFIYHDMIAHVPLFVHPCPKNVLIIGGGDGGTAREVLRHSQVEKCTMVEIDHMVVSACREHLKQTSKDLDHPKLKLIIGDGVEFVKNSKEVFDVIVVDSTDPIGPAAPLFDIEFYRTLDKCLDKSGIVVGQGESPWYEEKMQTKLLDIMSQVFPLTTLYNFHNLTYPGGFWSFAFASKGVHPLRDFDEKRVRESKLEFEYYNEGVHRASFALPQFMLNRYKNYLKI